MLVLAALAGAVLVLDWAPDVFDPRREEPRERRSGPGASERRHATERPYPTGAQIRRARRYAEGRSGLVSFAVLGSHGGVRGRAIDRSYVSASVVKALLLAAYLRQVDRTGEGLTSTARQRLAAMITYSDNDAANSIYYAVGDPGLAAVGRKAGMRDLELGGYWAKSYITAADMARFMWSLKRRMLPARHRAFAMRLLGGIIPAQRWGIAAAAKPAWEVWFKGGWRTTDEGYLSRQAALLRRGSRRFALSIVTDGQPSQVYANRTLRGVAARLLHGGSPSNPG